METYELKAQPRLAGSKPKQLRRDGYVPVVVYGKNIEPQKLQVTNRDLVKVLKQAGTHALISLQVESTKPKLTLARDIQRDVIKQHLLHVDFYAVQMDQKVQAKVPLVFEGESSAVITLGGVLTQGFDEITVECLPSELPSAITVNINSLDTLGATILVRDMDLPDNIAIIAEPDSMIVKVEAPRTVSETEFDTEIETDVEVETEAEADEE